MLVQQAWATPSLQPFVASYLNSGFPRVFQPIDRCRTIYWGYCYDIDVTRSQCLLNHDTLGHFWVQTFGKFKKIWTEPQWIFFPFSRDLLLQCSGILIPLRSSLSQLSMLSSLQGDSLLVSLDQKFQALPRYWSSDFPCSSPSHPSSPILLRPPHSSDNPVVERKC